MAFIGIEGLDGCGKDMQLELIRKRLIPEGMSAIFTREPGGTDLGEKIKEMVQDPTLNPDPMTSLFLYNASRRQWVVDFVIPKLKEGHNLLTSRTYLSSIAFQGHAEGIDAEMVRDICELAMSGAKYTKIFVLDVPVEVAAERLRARGANMSRYDRKPPAFHEKVREGFLKEAERSPALIEVINATPSPEEVFSQIWQKMEPLLR
jgi:dTMP kinase